MKNNTKKQTETPKYLELNIGEQSFQLSNSWASISYGKFIDILSIQEDKGYNDLEKSVKIISILSNDVDGCEKAMNENLTVEDLNILSEKIDWLKNDFVKEAEKIENKKYFIIDDKKYVIKSNYDKITLGEQTTVEHLLKNENLNPQEIALGILLRPLDENGKEEKFDIEFVHYVINELKYKLNLLEVYNYINFFLLGEKKSSKKHIRNFSINKKL